MIIYNVAKFYDIKSRKLFAQLLNRTKLLFHYHYYQVFNKSTPTGNTGPSAAAQGEWYAYMEASNGGHGDFTHLVITHPFKPGKQNYHKRQVSSALKQRHSKVMPLQHRAASCAP